MIQMPRIIAIRGIFVFSTIKYALEAALTHKVRIPSFPQKTVFNTVKNGFSVLSVIPAPKSN